MADSKITALDNLTSADPANDMIPIVDVSATPPASGNTKRISINNLLACSPSATLASATITGDLTVATNGLKVDSANKNVGINTATPTNTAGYKTLEIVGTGVNTAGMLRFKSSNTSVNTLDFADSNGRAIFAISNHPIRFGCNDIEQYRINPLGVFSWFDGLGGTRMTLNATGLGVGVVPVVPLHIYSGGTGTTDFGNVVGTFRTGASGRAVALQFSDTANFANIGMLSGALQFAAGGSTTHMTISTSGNVGIGVQPSAWAAGYKAIQISSNQSTALMGSGNQTELTTNAFFDGAWKYQGAGTVAASRYSQQSGVHYWYTAAAGAAETAIGSGFTNAAMTLDAVSSLHVNTTSYVNIGVGVVNSKNGYNIVQDNTGNAGNRNWNFSANGSAAGNLDIVVSSANNTYPNSAYRLQLTSAGAAYNTTGTWGTISDSRLKENISDARNYLADLLKLRVVKYSLKEEASAVATKLGLIAQEVEQVFPSLVEQSDVAYDGGDGIRTVKTSILVPMLLKAIQELTARVQTLETR